MTTAKKFAAIAVVAVSLAFVTVVALTFLPLEVSSQGNNAAFMEELTARRNTVVTFAETWASAEFGQTELLFDANINTNAAPEIWRVGIIDNAGNRLATIDVDRITGNITVIEIESPETHPLNISGANITIIDHTANNIFATLYTIQDVAVIVATKITQQFGVNLDGAEFSMGFIGGFWGVNILLDPERAPTGGLPYVIPDFHARLDEVTRTVTVNNLGELPSLVPVIEVEVEVEVEPALPTQTLDIDGATITIIDHTTDGNPELYTAQDVAAMVAAEITQQFGANLDGAEFTMGFIGGFWGVNVVLDPERTPTGGLPYLIPDFHASFIETEGILNVNDFDR